MGKSKEIASHVLYRFMFAVIIPVILILWAKYTRNIVTIRVPVNSLHGYILLITGAMFVCSGLWNLWRSDNRLYVHDFPPKRFAIIGLYDFTRKSICMGAALISFGLSAVSGSASGFWLVSPLFTLLMAAYVTELKNEKTHSVFGSQENRTSMSLHSTSNIMPSFGDRLSAYFLVFIPWLIIYKAFIFIGAPDEAICTNLPFEEHLPVWEFSTVFYSFAFLFSLSVPLVVKTRKHLKQFITDVWFTIIFVGIIYFVFPLIIKQRDFIPHSFLGHVILYERSVDGESGALPSCHVIWAFLAALYFTRSFVRFKWIWFGLGVLISLSCITVGAHSVLDVAAGFCAFIIIIYRQNIWDYLRLQAERLSNSRSEWRIGRLRIISHSFYSGAAGFTGTLLTGFFLGRQYALAGFLILIIVIIGARLSMQLVHGSPQLLRPFIFYGGPISGIIACILAKFIFSIDIFILLASFAMAAPWVNGVRCFSCLAKCYDHIRISKENIIIQLYSIGINIIIGLVMIRLFNIGISSSFIVGIYLILIGTGRFAKKSLHGGSQIQHWAGIRISQWISIFFVLSGIIFTAIPDTTVLAFQPNFLSLILASATGVLAAIVFGVNMKEIH